MNRIMQLAGILTLLYLCVGCDESEWTRNEITQVPVYSMTNIVKKSGEPTTVEKPFAINVYKERPLMIYYQNEVLLMNYTTENVEDKSTETNYDISFSIQEKSITDEKEAISKIYSYEIEGEKNAEKGILKIGIINDNDTVKTSYETIIEEIVKYN